MTTKASYVSYAAHDNKRTFSQKMTASTFQGALSRKQQKRFEIDPWFSVLLHYDPRGPRSRNAPVDLSISAAPCLCRDLLPCSIATEYNRRAHRPRRGRRRIRPLLLMHTWALTVGMHVTEGLTVGGSQRACTRCGGIKQEHAASVLLTSAQTLGSRIVRGMRMGRWCQLTHINGPHHCLHQVEERGHLRLSSCRGKCHQKGN